MKVLPAITPELEQWIKQQPMFFNATAPLGGQAHVNLSPRGLDSLRVIDPNQVAILDLTGSGNETAAHLLENGRITIMFCAFNGDPMILRLYGEGEVILPGDEDEDWADLRGLFAADLPGVRQIFRVLVTRVQTSCGYGVPLMDFVDQRDRLAIGRPKKVRPILLNTKKRKTAGVSTALPARLQINCALCWFIVRYVELTKLKSKNKPLPGNNFAFIHRSRNINELQCQKIVKYVKML